MPIGRPKRLKGRLEAPNCKSVDFNSNQCFGQHNTETEECSCCVIQNSCRKKTYNYKDTHIIIIREVR